MVERCKGSGEYQKIAMGDLEMPEISIKDNKGLLLYGALNFQLCWYGNKLPDKAIPLWEDGIQQWSGIFSNSFPRERLIFPLRSGYSGGSGSGGLW